MSASDKQAVWVGSRIRHERERLGWTGKDLAERAGVSPNTIVAVERGRSVRSGTLAKVRKALGIELDIPDPDPYTEAAVEAVANWMRAATTRDGQRERVTHILTAMAEFDHDNPDN